MEHMATNDAEFDLAQALVDLSISSNEQSSSSVPESNVRDSAHPSSGVLSVLNSSHSVSTPIRYIDPEKQTYPELPDTPEVSQKTQDSLVILQDACSLHKFSRTIRARDLDSIVERPERTRAAILGILAAGARLRALSLPHFDIIHSERKGWLGDNAVESVHGLVYPQDLLKIAGDVASRLDQGRLEIPENYPYGDLYLGPRSLDAINGCIGALYDGVDALFEKTYSRVHVCIRPPGHHAAETLPCGFCWINNVHVAIAHAREKYGVKRVAILDFDLHHGDGSQAIAWTLNEQCPNTIGYYSIHDIYSYPCEAGTIDKVREASVSLAAHGHNIHNVHLRPYTTDEQFNELYEQNYSSIFVKAAEYLSEGQIKGEKTMVCISAGYDASEHESSSMQRHKVSVPTSFYQRFTEDAVNLAEKYCNGKVLSVMEGGYGDRAITSAACSHMLGLSVRSTQETRIEHASWYNLESLKLLERVFPGKLRGARKGAKSTDVADKPWLKILEEAYDRHIPSTITLDSMPTDPSAILDLGKMTLRERRPGPPTPIAALPAVRAVRKTPRSTPSKPRGGKTPHTPALPSTLKANSPPLPPLPPIPNGTPTMAGYDHQESPLPALPITPEKQEEPDVHQSNASIEAEQQAPKVSDIYDFID